MEDNNPLFWIFALIGGGVAVGFFLAAVDKIGYQQQLCERLLDPQTCQAVAVFLEM